MKSATFVAPSGRRHTFTHRLGNFGFYVIEHVSYEGLYHRRSFTKKHPDVTVEGWRSERRVKETFELLVKQLSRKWYNLNAHERR
jgi:hypothetical protein